MKPIPKPHLTLWETSQFRCSVGDLDHATVMARDGRTPVGVDVGPGFVLVVRGLVSHRIQHNEVFWPRDLSLSAVLRTSEVLRAQYATQMEDPRPSWERLSDGATESRD